MSDQISKMKKHELLFGPDLRNELSFGPDLRNELSERKKHEKKMKKFIFFRFFHFFFIPQIWSERKFIPQIWSEQKFMFFSFRSVSGYLVRHHHSLFSFSKFNFTIMSNMNLLSFNFDSCAQSHPHNLRAFEVKKCFQIFCTGEHKLQPTAKKTEMKMNSK